MPSAGQDPLLDFLVCWYVATTGEGRHPVMAAIRSRAQRCDLLDPDGGHRLWSWCIDVWLPGWLRAAGLSKEARALERAGSALLPHVRHVARRAAMRQAGSGAPGCAVLDRIRAYAAVEASGAAAVACAGVADDQARLALATVRDAACVALRNGADLGRVVARSRQSALEVVDGGGGGDRRLRGAAPPLNAEQGGPACRT